ncbi:HET-domain-containing protein [Apiospora sp. TS-2023a]
MSVHCPTSARGGLYRVLTDRITPADADADAKATPAHQWATRFFNLLPGRLEDPIQCQLLESTIGEMQNRYEALSYTWGDATDKVPISVNDGPVSVTKNLEVALRHLRRESETRTLWVDALCINQSDVSEVSTHVQRMWAIYEHAGRALVFLGPQAEWSDEAFALLSELSSLEIGTEHHHRIAATLNNDLQEAEGPWQGLFRLMQRPWWRRAWVVQEYAVARQVVFLCGFRELPNEAFGKALEVLADYKFNGSLRPDHHQLIRRITAAPIHHLWSTRQNYQKSGPKSRPDVAAVIHRFRGHQAFDPRDKIYSLYRLIAENPRLAPDYGRSVVDLYKDVARVMMETSGTLEVLSHHNRGIEGVEGLPTWCPDWTVLRGKRFTLWPRNYHATRGLKDATSFFHIEGDTLRLRGKLLDRIRWLKGFASDDFENQETLYRDILDIELVARQMTTQEHDGAAADTFERAFRKTLVGARAFVKGRNDHYRTLSPNATDSLWVAWSSHVQGKPCDARLARRYSNALYGAMSGRAFVITEGGSMGLVDGTVQVGDVIGAFSGGRMPLALRQKESSPILTNAPNRYELVGEW